MANLFKSKTQRTLLFVAAIFSFIQMDVLANADENQTYLLVPKENGEMGISFKVPYTAGIHSGQAIDAEGKLAISSDGKIIEGSFVVPLASLATGNAKRDCHLREAMGLDYTKSQYPNEHVCSVANQLPQNGPDAIAYTTIDFDITGFAESTNIDGVITGTVSGEWSMHGVTQSFTAPIDATKTANGYRVQSKFNLSLAAYGIFVKPVLVVSVKDTVTVTLDLDLQKKP